VLSGQQTCGRSAGAAGAERGRATSPRPLAMGSLGTARLVVRLTPARSRCRNWAGQSGGPSGSGGLVPSGTTQNQFRTGLGTKQPVDFIVLSGCFWPWFQNPARSRYTDPANQPLSRSSICAHTRILEPEQNNALFSLDINRLCGSKQSSKLVLRGSGLEPAISDPPLASLGSLILAGGNSARVAQGARSGWMQAWVAESFGFAWRGRGGRGELEQLGEAGGRNGGFLRFRGRRSGDVGRATLEGRAQAVGVARQSGEARLPVRLRRAAAWRAGGAAWTPPLPPIARAPVPSSRALDRVGVRNVYAPPIAGGSSARGGTRQSVSRNFESGSGCVPRRLDTRAEDQGVRLGGELRRSEQRRTGGARVN
jgi:hypothetical protein